MFKKTNFKNLVVCIVVLFVSACSNSSTPNVGTPAPVPVDPTAERKAKLWSQVVTLYIKQPLWQESLIYDAGHALMLPIEYVFNQSKNAQQIKQLDDLFSRFNQNFEASLTTNNLSRFQFYYTTLRYLHFSQKNTLSAFQKELLDKIIKDINLLWFEKPTTQMGTSGNGQVEIVNWKLQNKGNSTPKFRRAIVDFELYGFALAAEIVALQKAQKLTPNAQISKILAQGLQVFESEVNYTNDGWLFQPGQWEDFQDYLYAGYATATAGLTPSPIQGIATDTSHSHRMPLWLLSLRNAYAKNSTQYNYYQSLRTGFSSQFEKVALKLSDAEFTGPRMTNYMDGNNGLFRYRFNDAPHLKLAYEAYNLSGTLLISFFPYMYNTALTSEYKKLKFPLSDNIVQLYQGLGPSVDKSSYTALSNYMKNGFAELYVLIATSMKESA